MEIDDRRAMAALLTTARAVLKERLQPQLRGEGRFEAAMVANAMALAARALEEPGTAWSKREVGPAASALASGDAAARARALRLHVAARLRVTQPGYVERVATAPL
ncbi:MAG: hypothetical protein ACOCYE_09365 [Pseudomonadota bacterium]